MTQEMRATALAEATRIGFGMRVEDIVSYAEAFYAFLAKDDEKPKSILISKDALRAMFGYGKESKYLDQMCSDIEIMAVNGLLPPIMVKP